ncbi:MAG TPA: hypothetical protein VFV51_05245 [Vicinamibacterales bacterium]|nr:hypothetical protein [Vicinamibacterales bacterium]
MKRIKTVIIAILLASFAGTSPAMAMEQRRDRDRDRDRWEDRWEQRREERRREERRREARRERREERREAYQDGYREGYWDAARYYRRDDRRYRPYRMTRNDRVYRGSDNRYYCRRDDGTTGLIVGGVAGAVLGNVIAPGGSKVLGSIIGGGAGALIGRAIDDGDIQCR